jgi:hypothetical protein
MAELIEREALLDEIQLAIEDGGCVNHEHDIMDCIRYAPTVDAVPVVRCRECRYAQPISDRAARAFNAERVRDCTSQRGDWKMVYGFSVVDADGYCDEGERMDADAPERGKDGRDG